MRVIMITGLARNGKDSTADIIQEYLQSKGKKVIRKAYGDYLKEICKTYANWDGNKDENGRHILQQVGTDIVREKLGLSDLWVYHVVNELLIAQEFGCDYAIITDCRFKNEVYIPKIMFDDTVTIKVERIGFESNLTKEQLQHKSETELEDLVPDILIRSMEGLENLKTVVISRMGEIA